MEYIDHSEEIKEFERLREDILTYANLNSNQKLRWISKYPEKTIDILDFLINITKDR